MRPWMGERHAGRQHQRPEPFQSTASRLVAARPLASASATFAALSSHTTAVAPPAFSASAVASPEPVLIFTGLTAYHVQRIQNGDIAAYAGTMEKGAVMGAFLMYLDFINLFFALLNIMGNRR